ncbi:hypothetical protein ACPF04_06470 [Campylobacter sp. MOP51]|uniref:hypothetical protein n=1 Tax=Campylobacter canis TaxID=3378588 RepID=UPI003C407B04
MKKIIYFMAVAFALLLPSSTLAVDNSDLTKAVVKLIKQYNELEMQVFSSEKSREASFEGVRKSLHDTNKKLEYLLNKLEALESQNTNTNKLIEDLKQKSYQPYEQAASTNMHNIKTEVIKQDKKELDKTRDNIQKQTKPKKPVKKDGGIVHKKQNPTKTEQVIKSCEEELAEAKGEIAKLRSQCIEKEMKQLKKSTNIKDASHDQIIQNFLKDKN